MLLYPLFTLIKNLLIFSPRAALRCHSAATPVSSPFPHTSRLAAVSPCTLLKGSGGGAGRGAPAPGGEVPAFLLCLRKKLSL
eukprot:scaffold223417_cov33-Tisochrysis_lutea.AAC.3